MNRVFGATSDLAVIIAEWRRQIREVVRLVRYRGFAETTQSGNGLPASLAADRHHQQSHFFIVFVLILLVLIGSVLGFLINIFRID